MFLHFTLFSSSLFLVFLCSVDSFILFRTKVTNLYFSSGVFFISCVSSPFRQPNSKPSYPTHFHDCVTSIYVSILYGFLNHLSSFVFVISATISYFSIHTLSSGSKSQHSNSFFTNPSHGPPHTFCNFHIERADPSAPISSWPYCTFLYGSRPTSRLFCAFFRRNNRVIVVVSHPFYFFHCLLCP